MNWHYQPLRRNEVQKTTSGFTLLELLVVILIVGAVVAIAAPGWLAFLNRQRLNTAQSQVLDILRQAQSTAKLKGVKYQASFKEQNGRVRWAIHPITVAASSASWNSLEKGVHLNPIETNPAADKAGIHKIQFNHYGEVSGSLGRITLSVPSSSAKRCVVVSTLLGAMRTGKNQPKRSGNPCD